MLTAHTKYLIRKYGEETVPRYTSYPTALKFHAHNVSEYHSIFLNALNAHNPVSVYIHIPYCHSLCHYCGCHTKIVNHTSVISTYVETLCREIELWGAKIPFKVPINRLHFGGGSPNYAPLSDIEKIIDKIRNVFVTDKNLSIDMECDPRLLNKEKIAGLARLGISRVSLGIQDFDERVQNAINRIQTSAHVQEQMDYFHDHGIDGINFDLIVGLPEQTLESVKNTVRQSILMRPTRIAVFAYAHVPWVKKHQKLLEKYCFPSPEERYAMQETIAQMLEHSGYKAIGIDHYALPKDHLCQAKINGTMRRNFQGYTDDQAQTIIGFGLSAISQFPEGYTQNTLDATTYRQTISRSDVPVAKVYKMTEDDINNSKAIMSFMCNLELDISDHPQAYVAHDRLSLLEKDAIIARKDTKIRILSTRKPFTRIVASCFDSYYNQDSYTEGQRHARAL